MTNSNKCPLPLFGINKVFSKPAQKNPVDGSYKKSYSIKIVYIENLNFFQFFTVDMTCF